MEAEPEIPVADLAADSPPSSSSSPTGRDRWIRRCLLASGFFIGGGAAFLILYPLADLLHPIGTFDAVLRGPAVQGSAFAASFVGIACAIGTSHLYLVRRFSDRRERILFLRSLRGWRPRVPSRVLTAEVADSLRRESQHRAEQYADRWAPYDNALVVAAVVVLMLLAAYCWLAWAGMDVVITGSEVSWRGFSLVRHVEPIAAVSAIYPTVRYVRDGETRPCLVVQFRDGRFINTQEMRITAAERDRAAAALARGSGVTPRQAPWLDLVPPPK